MANVTNMTGSSSSAINVTSVANVCPSACLGRITANLTQLSYNFFIMGPVSGPLVTGMAH